MRKTKFKNEDYVNGLQWYNFFCESLLTDQSQAKVFFSIPLKIIEAKWINPSKQEGGELCQMLRNVYFIPLKLSII